VPGAYPGLRAYLGRSIDGVLMKPPRRSRRSRGPGGPPRDGGGQRRGGGGGNGGGGGYLGIGWEWWGPLLGFLIILLMLFYAALAGAN
jgi:hypothetical protein